MRARVTWCWWLAVCIASCSWSRFDDLQSDTPVVRLDIPSGTILAGSALGSIAAKSGALALATSRSSVFLFNLGKERDAEPQTLREISCDTQQACSVAQQVAGLVHNTSNGERACFAYALETVNQRVRVRLGCEDGTNAALAIPANLAQEAPQRLASSQQAELRLASGPRQEPSVLLVAFPERNWVWWYPSTADAPVLLTPPETRPRLWGQSVAVLGAADDTSWLVVGEPENDRVWLYRGLRDGTTEPVSCLQGEPGFGRTLSTGHFDADALDDLAVADGSQVMLVDGATLADLAPDSDSGCLDVSEFSTPPRSCQSTEHTGGCARADFGAALGVSDLDDDGRDELLVGMPSATVRGKVRAGAIAVLSPAKDGLSWQDVLYLGSAGQDDRFGAAVAGLQLSRWDAVVAGIPGASKVAVLYCSALIPDSADDPRCH